MRIIDIHLFLNNKVTEIYNKIKITFINVYLYLIKLLHKIIHKFKKIFVDTVDISVIKYSENTPVSVLYRYYLLRVIIYLSKYLNYFISKIDMRVTHIKVVKDTIDGNKYMIIEQDNNKLMLSDVINYVEKKGVDKTLNNCIFNKFELVTGGNNVCMKKYLIEYSDVNEDHCNTLENIIKFNNIFVDDCTKLNIIKYINKEKKEYTFDYKNISNKHINYFCKLI